MTPMTTTTTSMIRTITATSSDHMVVSWIFQRVRGAGGGIGGGGVRFFHFRDIAPGNQTTAGHPRRSGGEDRSVDGIAPPWEKASDLLEHRNGADEGQRRAVRRRGRARDLRVSPGPVGTGVWTDPDGPIAHLAKQNGVEHHAFATRC
jgi:hypothetical protein